MRRALRFSHLITIKDMPAHVTRIPATCTCRFAREKPSALHASRNIVIIGPITGSAYALQLVPARIDFVADEKEKESERGREREREREKQKYTSQTRGHALNFHYAATHVNYAPHHRLSSTIPLSPIIREEDPRQDRFSFNRFSKIRRDAMRNRLTKQNTNPRGS